MLKMQYRDGQRSAFWPRIPGKRARYALLALLVSCSLSVHAATFVVDDLGDFGDANPGDGQALTDKGVTTLRAAIEEANADTTPDTINFDMTSLGTPATIGVSTQLEVTQPLSILGPGASELAISGQDVTQVFNYLGESEGDTIHGDGITDIVIEDLTIRDGFAQGSGGGAAIIKYVDAAIRRCDIRENRGDLVAGGVLYSNGSFVLEDCRFIDNTLEHFLAESGGASVARADVTMMRCRFAGNNGNKRVGGLAVWVDGGTTLIADCVFEENEAREVGGVELSGSSPFPPLITGCTFLANVTTALEGGALDVSVPTVVVNSTFVGNQGAMRGATILAEDDLRLVNCTIVGNELGPADTAGSLFEYGGAGIYVADGLLEIGNTIIAQNVSTIDEVTAFDDIFVGAEATETPVSLGGNLIGATAGTEGFYLASDQTGTQEAPLDPLLGPLGLYGGLTATLLPLPGSPVLDNGLNSLVANPPFDGPPFYEQRGGLFPRIHNGTVDIGATEAQPYDDIPPVITLTGAATLDHECGETFTDPGATATDDSDGDITAFIVISGSVDTATPGDYFLSYDVSDAIGNSADTVTRTVTVVDTTPPVITLTGDATITLTCETEYIDLGATATDTCDTALPAVTVDTSALTIYRTGQYDVTYTVTDTSGNDAVPVTRTVVVEGPCPVHAHTADQDQDNEISLSELLRAIQFFNSDGFHCQEGTEDGYAPGPGDTAGCPPHACDYNPLDWEIDLSELLRLIQFFNSAGYYACPEGEDGYCPLIS